MDLSLLPDSFGMDDSLFLLSQPEAMDDEVTRIIKKWNTNNPPRTKEIEAVNNAHNPIESFDTRTFTRPKRRLAPQTEELESIESGIESINLHVGGPMSFTPKLMQKSWLNDVSPPNSICASMDFQNNDNMLGSLITSGDFSDMSFLRSDSTAGTSGNETLVPMNQTVIKGAAPANITRNLMDFTFDVKKDDNATYIASADSPFKEFGIDNADMQFSDLTNEQIDKNFTFNARTDSPNLTWSGIPQSHQEHLDRNVVQSTPVHTATSNRDDLAKTFIHGFSPISSVSNAAEGEETEVVIRNVKSRKLINDITFDEYRNSIEDQCEFLLNEETIKLSSKLCGESFDLKASFIESADANENDFDKMLDSFNVKKSLESEKLLQSVDTIKQRHSLINFEKQREEKQKKDDEYDNKTQYEAMNKSNERLLRRSRLYDDVNLQLQKQQINTAPVDAGKSEQACDDELNEEVDRSNRDRFKTIKLNKKLKTGMVIVDDDDDSEEQKPSDCNTTSPGANKEHRNHINQLKQGQEEPEFKKPAPSRMNKFGFTRPPYACRNNLNLPLKANSTDSLDNDDARETRSSTNVKSPMGVKSKSIHNLMYNGNRMGSYGNLKLTSGATRSQSNLKTPRSSSLARAAAEQAPFNGSAPSFQQGRAPSSRKTSLIRPSSGYYGNYGSKRADSDNESGCSLSSSSASSRNSVQLPDPHRHYQQNENSAPFENVKSATVTGAIPKSSGMRQPSSLRAPQARSGLPRPSGIVRR